MPSPLAANINNGVLIDMAKFNGVSYDAVRNEAKVGAGQRWGNVYDALDPYNVTVVGGRVLDVGVGGFILGSWFVSSFSIDQGLLRPQVVYRTSPISTVSLVIM